jgi:hypothetical protein
MSSFCPGGVKRTRAASSLLSKADFASTEAKLASKCKRTRFVAISKSNHVVKSFQNKIITDQYTQ